MKVWLIYDKERYSINAFYAKLYVKHFARVGISCDIIMIENLSYTNKRWYYENKEVELPLCAIMRTYNCGLSSSLENNGIRVFNNSRVAEICNNKFLTYKLAKKHDLPVMETVLVSGDSGVEVPFKLPYVAKSLDGHGGKEVFLITSEDEFCEINEKLLHKPFIVQRLAESVGKDLRVYVLGGNIIAGMLRTSQKDFRSNYSLGGNATRVEISDEIKDIVKKVNEILPSDFIGVDFIFDRDGVKLNEIEDIVGSRMLYEIGIDIVKDYVAYIMTCLIK
ncbi:MAG: ATP-grasp domain-containing protein [Clostridia bacterium]